MWTFVDLEDETKSFASPADKYAEACMQYVEFLIRQGLITIE